MTGIDGNGPSEFCLFSCEFGAADSEEKHGGNQVSRRGVELQPLRKRHPLVQLSRHGPGLGDQAVLDFQGAQSSREEGLQFAADSRDASV